MKRPSSAASSTNIMILCCFWVLSSIFFFLIDEVNKSNRVHAGEVIFDRVAVLVDDARDHRQIWGIKYSEIRRHTHFLVESKIAFRSMNYALAHHCTHSLGSTEL